MNKMIKQSVGIDLAQKELVVCLGDLYEDWSVELYVHKNFTNTNQRIRFSGAVGFETN